MAELNPFDSVFGEEPKWGNCPACRQDAPLPKCGVQELKTNFIVQPVYRSVPDHSRSPQTLTLTIAYRKRAAKLLIWSFPRFDLTEENKDTNPLGLSHISAGYGVGDQYMKFKFKKQRKIAFPPGTSEGKVDCLTSGDYVDVFLESRRHVRIPTGESLNKRRDPASQVSPVRAGLRQVLQARGHFLHFRTATYRQARPGSARLPHRATCNRPHGRSESRKGESL
ncbi:hypothetical protein Bbelb_103600 [Branchiostoma belcheri]|nr:hypothetical protein Bbelb_103600 [Branchiostoma belcheri]